MDPKPKSSPKLQITNKQAKHIPKHLSIYANQVANREIADESSTIFEPKLIFDLGQSLYFIRTNGNMFTLIISTA